LSYAVSNKKKDGIQFGKSQSIIGSNAYASGITKIKEYGTNLSKSVVILQLVASSNPVNYFFDFFLYRFLSHLKSDHKSLDP
jgi:hypothetical protein